MNEKYLTINAGSSSLKFSLYEANGKEIVNGLIEKIGNDDSGYTLKFDDKKIEKQMLIRNHTEAVNAMISELLENKFIISKDEIKGIGHRVLHGGEKYSDSVLIDEEVIKTIKDLTKLGPLHHPGEIAGIESMIKFFPGVPQIAVFDTAFHQTMPKQNFMYAIPYLWYKEHGVRKYGFHGTSHKYITEVMKKHYNKEDVNLIICHIGSGASISAIKNGKCYNTSMGLTPVDGLVMGTRCGAIDPSIVEYICKEANITVEQAVEILNKKSGLFGLCGKNDFRDVENLAKNGDKNAQIALAIFKKSIIDYIAQYYFQLNGEIDALVFTAGIGENAINLRRDIVNSISKPMRILLDEKENDKISRGKEKTSGIISTDSSSFEVVVVPTNEEFMILKDTYDIANKYYIEQKEKQKVL